ncbi:MAG: NAD-dependent epimerase/dehydratase family protein [Gammaproteobacteria bacterium]|nr:NAD-dependent epimerase/dehydratase family protein [Gammaproteobacteria bacterium]MDH3468149.1 NAD-dependent epimerase/dehydratase family protein [Gammaproteobacteria bacterium]
MERVLITGGAGFIGTNLIPRLIADDRYVVTVLDNMSNVSGDLEPSARVEIVEGDIRNISIVDRLVKDADVVIHLAAHTRVMDSIDEPGLNFDINVQGTFNVLESMRRQDIKRFVNASTGGAILGEVPPPVHEEMAARPASPYGASKLAAEGYCSAYAQSYGMSAVSLRFSNLYGPHSRNKGSVVAKFIKDITRKGEIEVYGDGSQTRDFLYVEDLVDGICRAIDKRVSGVFQLGQGLPNSVNDLIKIARSVLGKDFDVKFKNFRPGEIRHTYCDISKATKCFGYAPLTTLEDGFKKTWDWFVANE